MTPLAIACCGLVLGVVLSEVVDGYRERWPLETVAPAWIRAAVTLIRLAVFAAFGIASWSLVSLAVRALQSH